MNKKKLLALLMTFVMLCTSFSFAYAENTDVATDTVEENAEIIDTDEFRALYAMGFLGEEMTVTPKDAFITRAQFTGYLFKLAGYTLIEHKTSEIPFKDVSLETPYYNEICTMHTMSIVNGTEPDRFSPDAHVTCAQACKLIVDVLGYRNYVSVRYGEFPEGYISMASELEINDGVKNVKWDSELTAEDAMTMLYNAGFAEIMSFSGVDANGNAKYETEGVDLFESNDIYFAEGIMQSNGIASIEALDATENVTVISDKRYVSADVDLTHLLGCKVKYFYRDTDVEKKLLWAYEDTRLNNVIDLNAIDLITDDASYSMTNIVYYEADGDKESIKVHELANVVYNNSFYAIPNDDIMKPKTGTMRLIDNNDDEIFDTVVIEEFYNVFVKNVVLTTQTISDKYNNSIKLSDYKLVKLIKDGKEVSLAEISSGVLLSCVENKEKTKIYVYIMTEKGDGVLNRISSSRNHKVYNFEGGSYRLSSTYEKMIDEYNASQSAPSATASVTKVIIPQPGMKYTYYLDKAGEIAEIQAPNTGLQYALLMSVTPGEVYEDGAVYTRLLLTDGSKVSGITKKKIKINGTRQVSTNIVAAANNADGEFEAQVVQVAFDEEGYLKEIIFAVDSTDETLYPYGYNANDFSLDYKNNKLGRVSDGFYMINYRYMLDNNTVVFYKWSNYENIGNEPYSVGTRANIQQGNYTYQFYDVQADMTVPVVYSPSYYNAEAFWLDGSMLVETTDVVFEDGEELRRVTGYMAGEYKTVTELYPGVIPADLQKGDLIKISHQDSKATKVVVEMGVEDFMDKTPRLISGASPDAIDTRRFVPVYGVSTVGLTMINPAEWEATYGKTTSAAFKSGLKVLVLIYDTKTGEISTGDIHDLYQIYSPNEDGSLPDADDLVMVYARTRYSALYEAVIVLY